MHQNRALHKMRDGSPITICWLVSGSPLLAEAAARLGFDAVLIDTQHGYWPREALINALQVIGSSDSVPLVRVLRNEPHIIGQALDYGALGVIVPLVNTAAGAEAAAHAARYPPAGIRSAGGVRLAYWGDDHIPDANDEIMVVVMIETREAVANAEAIAGVPGVDCLMIGPGDLALSLGCFGDRNEEHATAIQHVIEAGRAAGVAVGMACSGPEEAIRRAEQGMLFLASGSDWGWFTSGGRAGQEALSEGLAKLGAPGQTGRNARPTGAPG